METREGKVWNTFFMHLSFSTMHLYLTEGGWSLDEVYEYTLRRMRRGDFAYAEEEFLEQAILEWSVMSPEGFSYSAFNNTRLKAPSIFGIYEYDVSEDPKEAGLRVASEICQRTSELNEWTHTPKLQLSDHDDFIQESAGVLDMRIDLLAANTEMPRTAVPMGCIKGLLEWDDAVTSNFEYLLHVQAQPGISEGDYREASHLLHRVSCVRFSLMDRIRNENIHVESDPDLASS